MTLDKNILKEALNESQLAKGKDIASLISALGGKATTMSSTASADRSSQASDKASDGLSKFADSLGTGAGVFVDSFKNIGGKVMDVNLRLSDLAVEGGNFSKTIIGQVLGFESLGKIVGVTADVLADVVIYAEKNVDTWRRLSDVGASFGNDAIAMDVAAKNMRISTDDLADIVKKNTADFARMGGTVQSGAKVFTDFSRVFQDSGYNEQLLQAGMTQKEINELLAVQATSTRSMLRMRTPAQMEKEAESARNLALEMDAMARLTGKSRQEQMEAQRALKNDAQTQAAINIAIAKGGKDVQVAFDSARVAASRVGPEMQSLVKGVLAAGQLPVNATREQQQMYGMLGAEARNLLKQASDATLAGKSELAAQLTNQALVSAARSDEMKSIEARAKQGVETDMMIYRNFMQLKQNTQAAEENARAVGKSSLTTRELADFSVAEAKKEAQTRTGVTSTIVGAENEGKKLSAALANNLISPLNDKIGPGLDTFYKTQLLPRSKLPPNATDYQTSQTPPPMIRSDEGDELRRRERERRGIKIPGSLDDTNKKEGGDSFLGKLGLGALSLSDGIINITKEAKIYMDGVPKKQTGSLGTTGKLMEDFGSGTLAMLHGRESVVTEDQMKNLMSNVQSSSMQNMPQMLQQALGTLKTAMPSAAQNTDSMASDFQSVASTLSNDASLNDLLGALNQLNTKMNQLIDTHADVGSRQIRATKSNNANLFAR